MYLTSSLEGGLRRMIFMLLHPNKIQDGKERIY
jgi:hypothetical protein